MLMAPTASRCPVQPHSTHTHTHLVAVIRCSEPEAGWAALTGMGRIYPFHRDTCPCCLVGDEGGELTERPGGHHAGGFAGRGHRPAMGPTACACRALAGAVADTSELLQANDAHALLLGMRDDLGRKVVVGLAHPAPFFALARAHRTPLPSVLQGCAVCVALAALGALLA